GTILAGWGESTWESTKNAAHSARESRAEKKAWKENTHRVPGEDTPEKPRKRHTDSASSADSDGDSAGPAPVVPLTDQAADPELTSDQQEAVERFRAALRNGDAASANLTGEEWTGLPEEMRQTLIDEAGQVGIRMREYDQEGNTARRSVSAPQHDPEYGRLEITDNGEGGIRIRSGPGITGNSNIHGISGDPSTWTGTDRYGRDIQTGRGESRDVTGPDGIPSVVHDSDIGGGESLERSAVIRHQAGCDPAGIAPSGDTPMASQNDTPVDTPAHTEGGTMTQSGEITDLPSAISYCQSTAAYCDQIAG